MTSQRSIPSVLIVFLLCSLCAWAGITGSISGIVTDPTGAIVPGANVVATNVLTNVRSESKTDSQGFYNFPALAIGTYSVEVAVSGFKTYRQSGLVIDANSALRVDVSLQIGQTTEAVTVVADRKSTRLNSSHRL